ncbi:MAG: caspase family protein [Treponema sp.]|nr:caspase family protein [Treponema sp.]
MKKSLFFAVLFFFVSLLEAQEVSVYPQLGHSDLVNTAVYSPDGKFILSSSWDETIKIWDAASGREIKTIPVHGKTPLCAVWDKGGLFIAAGFWDGSVSIWDRESGAELKSFKGHGGAVNAVLFNADDSRIITASFDGTIKVWDSVSAENTGTMNASGTVNAAVCSPDGDSLASGGGDGIIRVWEAETGVEFMTFAGNGGAVTALAWTVGNRIIAGYFDGSIGIWDAKTGARVRVINAHTGTVNGLAVNPAGSRIISGSMDRTLKIWNIETGALVRSIKGHGKPVRSVAWNPAGRRVLSASFDKTIREWDAESGALLASYSGSIDYANSAGFRFDTKYIISGAADTLDSGGALNIWEAETGALVRSLSGHTKGVSTVAFNPDGSLALSGSGDSSLKIWDTESGAMLRTLNGHTNRITTALFSPDASRVLSASWDGTLMIWDTASGAVLKTLSGNTGIVYAAAWSPNSKRILSGDRNGFIREWNAETGIELGSFTPNDGSISFITYSPDGKYFAYASYANIISVYKAGMNEENRLFNLVGHGDAVNSLAYSPDGKWIASASGQTDISSGDKTIRVWDAASGKELLCLTGHTGNVASAAFSPDGRHIVSSSSDGTVRLWAVEANTDGALSGREMLRFIAFTDGEWICITPEGYYNASARGDQHLNVRIGDEVYGMDNFRGIFYRPDAVSIALSGDNEAYLASIGGRRIQDAGDFLPPKIDIREPELEITQGFARVPVVFTGETQAVKNIRVIVRGHLIAHEEMEGPESNRARGTDQAGPIERIYPVKLKPGWNNIEIIAGNGFSDDSRSIEIYYAGSEAAAVPNLWILAIGVNQYEDAVLENLAYAGADAEAIIRSFKAQEGSLYGKVNSLLVTGAQGKSPTRDVVIESLSFLKQAGGQDMTVLFIAGHGVSGRDNNFLFLPADAAHTDDITIWENAVSRQEIDAVLRNILGRKIVFIDACHSAGIAGGKAKSVDSNRLFRDIDDGSTIVLTSSRGNESSLERVEFGHGLFTYSIIQGLAGAADLDIGGLGKDGLITLNELNTYVQIMVPRLSDRKQNPTINTPAGFSDFDVADLRKMGYIE